MKKRGNPRNDKKKVDISTLITNVPVFSEIVNILIMDDNKSIKSLRGIVMKYLISLVVKQIEEHSEYIPFHLSEPVRTNSSK